MQPDVLSASSRRPRPAELVLTSLMVKLRCESLAERALIPAFIFFFQMLYPVRLGQSAADRATAGAAGGCMLVRADALRQAGGIEAIRNALIDDCALASNPQGARPDLARAHRTRRTASAPIRTSRTSGAWWRARPMRNCATRRCILPAVLAGMGLTYLVPPLMALFGTGSARIFGLAAWLLMAIAFQPTLRFYRLSPLWGIALPAIAFCYMLFTLESALQFGRGKGGLWKGRFQASEDQ